LNADVVGDGGLLNSLVMSCLSLSLSLYLYIFAFSNLHQMEPPYWLFILSAMQNWHVNSPRVCIHVSAWGKMTQSPKWKSVVPNTLTDEFRYVRGCDLKTK